MPLKINLACISIWMTGLGFSFHFRLSNNIQPDRTRRPSISCGTYARSEERLQEPQSQHSLVFKEPEVMLHNEGREFRSYKVPARQYHSLYFLGK